MDRRGTAQSAPCVFAPCERRASHRPRLAMRARRPVRVLELRSVRGTGGGPEKTILLSAAMADVSRVQVSVCYIRDQRDEVFAIDQRAAQAGVDYIELRERHSFDMSVWHQLRRLIAERHINIIHAHEYKTDLLALLLARSTGARALATVHGWTGHSRRERLLYYPLDKRVLARFPRLIAVSTDIANELIAHGANPARVTTILNAIDARQFRRDPAREAAARAALGLAPDDVVIGAVGRLEPQKRFDVLLDAFASLRRANARLRLVIAGDGSLRSALHEQCRRLHLGDSVVLPGHTPDVVALHHAFDLFAQSSEYEGTPNAVLEAMAMETPIVATEAGGTAELVHDGQHGRIIPIGRAAALIAAIQSALATPAATRAMAEQARRRVEGELSFENRVRRVEAIYEEMADSSGALREAYA
jgi:glycosyltransferase involved in cell wall biosynthesis